MLEPCRDEFVPSAAHPLGLLWVDHTEGPEREAQQRPVRDLLEVERGDADGEAEVKRSRHREMVVRRQSGDRRDHLPAVIPVLDKVASERRVERDRQRPQIDRRVTPPAADVLGERREHLVWGPGDRHVKRHVDCGPVHVSLRPTLQPQ